MNECKIMINNKIIIG